jgi:predicted nucleotidyltransferase
MRKPACDVSSSSKRSGLFGEREIGISREEDREMKRVSSASVPVVQEMLQEMVRRLVVQFAPEKIILFGSHARGHAGPDSDIDLLVVKPVTGSRRQERVAMRVALRGMGMAKDVLLVTPEEVEASRDLPGAVIRSALREGRVLYERSV